MLVKSFFSFALAACLVSSVSGHACMTGVTGANGINGEGFGIVDGTPRDSGLPIKKNEGDTSIIRDKEIQSGKVQACGRTEFNGNNDVASDLAAASQAGLPSTDANGALQMTMHQVNQDGAGPFTCDVSTDGGNTFPIQATVTQDVPGKRGLSLATATDFPLAAVVPAGTQCTAGPSGNACIMRCRNPALAGPFGGCAAFTMGTSNSSTASSSADTSTNSSTDSSTGSSATDAAAATSDSTAASTTDSASESAETNSATTESSADSTVPQSAASGATEDVADNKAAGKKAAGKGLLAALPKHRVKRVLNSRIAGDKAGYWL